MNDIIQVEQKSYPCCKNWCTSILLTCSGAKDCCWLFLKSLVFFTLVSVSEFASFSFRVSNAGPIFFRLDDELLRLKTMQDRAIMTSLEGQGLLRLESIIDLKKDFQNYWLLNFAEPEKVLGWRILCMLTLFSGCSFPGVRCLGLLDLCLITRETTRDSRTWVCI